MATIKFTRALKRFYPNLSTLQVEATTVAEVVKSLGESHPGLNDYIVDERGSLRQHVNIFIQNSLISDREHLTDTLDDKDEVYIMRALSGG